MEYIKILDTSKSDLNIKFGVYLGMEYNKDGETIIKVRRLTEPEQTEFERLGLKNSRFTYTSDNVVWVRREKIKKKETGVYYVVLYKGYPIYEPAEGGYYYEGLEVSGYKKFTNRQDARKFLRLYATTNNFNVAKNGLHAYKSGVNIGDSEEIYVERKIGYHIKGKQTYC